MADNALLRAHHSLCDLVDNYGLPLFQSSISLLEEINSLHDTKECISQGGNSLNVYADYTGLFDCIYKDSYLKIKDKKNEWKNILSKLEQQRKSFDVTFGTQQYKRPSKLTRSKPAFRMLPEFQENHDRIFRL